MNTVRFFRYENGTSWAGAGVFVGVVPVPVAVPSGKYHNRIYLRADRTVGLIQEYGEIKSGVGVSCGSNECVWQAGRVEDNQYGDDPAAAIESWCSLPAPGL